MRRFYSPQGNFADGNVTLDADETRHLRDVLRLKVGDEVSVFDGEGHEYRCTIAEISKKSTVLKVIEETQAASPESPFEITIAATVLNGEKYDLIVQKAVELGVVRLIPLHNDLIVQKAVELGVVRLIPLQTIRCDVKAKDAAKRMERWRRIAMEATKQTGRAKLMQIAEPVAFDQLIAGSQRENVVLFSERDGMDFSTISKGKKITALYGPKGGWDDSELESAKANGVNIVTLGGRILRAETASIAITAILQHRFGDLK